MQEFLASYAVEVDESGAKKLQEILKSNRELAESLAGAFDAARTALKSLDTSMDALDVRTALREKLQLSELPALDLKAELDLTEATASAETWMAQLEALRPKLKANTSGITTAVSSAVSSIRSMLSSLSITVPVRAVVTLDTSGLPTGGPDDPGDAGGERGGSGSFTIPAFANGGRVDAPTVAMIGEESEPEYVIPVNKEERAVPLVRGLLSEMSEPAKESVLGAEEAEPEKESRLDQETVPSVRETFLSPVMVPPVTDLFHNNQEPMEDTSVSDSDSFPDMIAVSPDADTVQPVVNITSVLESIRPISESLPEKEPVPLVQEAMPKTEPVPKIKESLPETGAVPLVQESLPETKPIRTVKASLPESKTFPSVKESIPEPETVLSEAVSLHDEEPIPEVKDFLPKTEAIPPVTESISVPEELPPVLKQMADQPAPIPVKDVLTEQPVPVPLLDKPSKQVYKPRIALSPMNGGKTDPIDIPAADLLIPERITDLIMEPKEPVPDNARSSIPSESIPQVSSLPETPKAIFKGLTDSYTDVDLSLLRDALADLSKMTLSQAPDLTFVPSMLQELTEVARSQFMPAGVPMPAPSHSVEAPVTIQVNSPYASPEEVGRSVYDLTQRYLIRTMKGVFT